MIMKILDLTLTCEEGMRGVSFENAKSKSVDGWNSKTLHLYSHAGTHMDAPFHFEVNSQTIDEYEVSRFICDSWVIPIDAHAGHKIKLEDLSVHAGLITKGDGVILKTGWSAYVNESKYREGLPGVDETLANWFVGKGINMLAVESPSIADVMDLKEVTKIHEILLRGNVILVEGLTNLDSVSRDKVKLIALPLKIKRGDGAPARVIAIEK
jgi:kynurenine formamidase